MEEIKMKKLIVYTLMVCLSLSIVLAASSVTRSVDNQNPAVGDKVTVTLTAVLADSDGANNEVVIIKEPVPAWSYTLGDFRLDSTENVLSIVEFDKSAGTYTYSYTVTASSSGLSFSGGKYQVGEGANYGSFISTGGISKLGDGNSGGGNGGGNGVGIGVILLIAGGGLVLYFMNKK